MTTPASAKEKTIEDLKKKRKFRKTRSTSAQQGAFCHAGCRINPDRHIANKLNSQLNEHNRALEYIISFLSLISNSTGLKPARTYRSWTGKLNTAHIRYGRVTQYQHSRKPWTLCVTSFNIFRNKICFILILTFVLS